MIVNLEVHYIFDYIILVSTGFTLFWVKIGASNDPEKRFLSKKTLIH